jgi:hypothetical protein
MHGAWSSGDSPPISASPSRSPAARARPGVRNASGAAAPRRAQRRQRQGPSGRSEWVSCRGSEARSTPAAYLPGNDSAPMAPLGRPLPVVSAPSHGGHASGGWIRAVEAVCQPEPSKSRLSERSCPESLPPRDGRRPAAASPRGVDGGRREVDGGRREVDGQVARRPAGGTVRWSSDGRWSERFRHMVTRRSPSSGRARSARGSIRIRA